MYLRSATSTNKGSLMTANFWLKCDKCEDFLRSATSTTNKGLLMTVNYWLKCDKCEDFRNPRTFTATGICRKNVAFVILHYYK